MMRLIVESQTEQAVVLALHGQIAGEAVGLLAREGTRYRQTGACLVLKLDGIDFIDTAGLTLLCGWAGPRLRLHGGSPFLQALLAATGLEAD